MHLTRRQKEILDFLGRHIERKGYAPTIEEIGEHFGLTLARDRPQAPHEPPGEGPHQARRGTAAAPSSSSRPRSGSRPSSCPCSAGWPPARPIEAIAGTETIFVPEDMVGRKETYVLQVKGDSMIDEQIRDGDYVIVENRKTARDGEMVIALLEGENVTLKKMYREGGGKVRLQPANARLKPIFVDQDDLQVQGVVIGVLRRVLTRRSRLGRGGPDGREEDRVNFTDHPRRGRDGAAGLQQLLLDPELARSTSP